MSGFLRSLVQALQPPLRREGLIELLERWVKMSEITRSDSNAHLSNQETGKNFIVL